MRAEEFHQSYPGIPSTFFIRFSNELFGNFGGRDDYHANEEYSYKLI